MIQWTKQIIPAKYRAYLHLAAFNVQLQGQRTVLFQSQICNQRSLNKYYNRSSSTRHMLSKFSTTTFDSQVFSYVGAIGAIIAALVLRSDRVNEATAIVPESHESPFKHEQTIGLANLASAIRHNSCSTQKQASELTPSFRYSRMERISDACSGVASTGVVVASIEFARWHCCIRGHGICTPWLPTDVDAPGSLRIPIHVQKRNDSLN